MKIMILGLITISFAQCVFGQTQSKPDDALLLGYYQTQRFADAADYLKRTYPEPVSDEKVLTQLAYTSQMAGRLADAEGYYQRIYDADSTNTTVLFNLGAINLRRGNNVKAETYYRKIALRDTTNFMVYKQLAAICQAKEDAANQQVFLVKANKLNAADPDVASDLSDIYVSQKQFDDADSVLSKAIAADPENAVLLLSKLKLNYGQEKWEEVKKTSNDLLRLGAASGYVLLKLEIAYFKLNDYQCCIETQADISSPEQTETSYYVAGLAYKALNRQQDAANYFARAINAGISPNIADYYDEMADSYEMLKNFRAAAFAYEKGRQFEEKAITYYMLASLYDDNLKNKKMARLYYKKFINTDTAKKDKKYVDYAHSRVKALSVH